MYSISAYQESGNVNSDSEDTRVSRQPGEHSFSLLQPLLLMGVTKTNKQTNPIFIDYFLSKNLKEIPIPLMK